MGCAEVRRQLEAYVDAELDVATSGRIRAHLAACPGCAGHHRAAIGLPGRLGALASPNAPDLVPAVMATIRHRRMRRELSAALLAAEAVLACIALVQLGLDGLLAAAVSTLQDGGALFGGSTPAPAAGDLGLVLTLLLLVAVSAVHLGLIGASTPLRRRA